jgi:hypothetical protein
MEKERFQSEGGLGKIKTSSGVKEYSHIPFPVVLMKCYKILL